MIAIACLLLSLASASASAELRPGVDADERVELAAALHILASGHAPLRGFARDGSPYARVLMEIVSSAARHPAVGAYRRLASRPGAAGRGYMGALRELTLCLDRDLVLVASPECARSPLAAPAASFAEETDFPARWRRRARPLLEPAVRELVARRDQADLVALFEEYAGLLSAAPQRVVPSPLLEPGQFWNGRLSEGDSAATEILTVLSPVARKRGTYRWTPVMRDVWHEQAHALMDGWLDEAPFSRILERPALKGRALEACYGSWAQCVREHVAQGVGAAVLEWSRREKRLSVHADAERKRTLPFLGKMAARLREYESDRARYPTLRDFLPRLLEDLEGPAAEPAAVGKAAVVAGPTVGPYEEALAARAAGRAAAAAAGLEKAVGANPRNAQAWLSLAVVAGELGRTARAVRAADRAVALARADGSLAPEFLSDALSTRAELRKAAGDAAGARADLAEALAAAPGDWPRAAEVRRSLGR